MSVLTLTGRPINWDKPPSATDKVLWSMRSQSGKKVIGSLRTISHLDRLNALSKKRFGQSIVVIQTPYNSGVSASQGTHDFDAVLDVWIPGVDGRVQERFLRANGAGAYYRYPPKFGRHQHYFTLPRVIAGDVSRRWQRAGFKVGYLVDGGWSTKGRVVSSSQIADYYAKPMRNALTGHARDAGWHPTNNYANVFDLASYIRARKTVAAVVVGKPKPQKPGWGSFVHLPPTGYMDYSHAIDVAAARKTGRAVDIDLQQDEQGTMWGAHWQDITKNGLHDPLGKIKPHTLLNTLSTAEVLRLRDSTGKRGLHRITWLLDKAARKKVRVELELKKLLSTAKVKSLLSRPATKVMHRAGLLQFKTLAQLDGASTRMKAAHAGGGITLLSFTGYTGKGISRAAWPFIDYTRGTPKWI